MDFAEGPVVMICRLARGIGIVIVCGGRLPDRRTSRHVAPLSSRFARRDGIRLAQAEALMESMKAFLHSRFGDEASSVPVVLAGDLNTVPGVGVYRRAFGVDIAVA